MKKIATLLFALIIAGNLLKAQNNSLIIYSQDGLKFTVILNGVRQNAQPETNVKVTGLNAPNYQTKIIFANGIADVNQNTYLTNGAENTQNTEYTYAIVNKKGKYKLSYRSAAPIGGAASATSQQSVVAYHPTNTVTSGTQVTGTTVTNSTTTTSNGNGNTLGVNVNAGGTGINININDGLATTNTTSTTTSSTIVTTTTTGTSGGGSAHPVGPTPINNGYVLEGYNGVYGCPMPMSNNDFESAKKSIASKGFDETRLTLAKQIIGSNCLLCSQIKEMMELMSFEATKLDLAKYAWHHNLDKGNYYKLNDAFSFESSIEELNKYTQSH